MLIVNTLFLIFICMMGIPVLWFCIQIILGCWPAKKSEAVKKSSQDSSVHRIAVLIPAHNESINLLPTLRAVLSQGNEALRVVVVADNCTDDTAHIARLEGVEVIERTNAELRGKGYALDFGIQHLKACPPQVVIVLDADCIPDEGVLQTLADKAIKTSRPVQALYLMKNGEAPKLKAKIAEFAWLVKNHVRPRGMKRMGLPCQLTGSGMAFPWSLLQQVSLATGHIVEDMKLGMALAELGHPPLFCEYSMVSSVFPNNTEGVQSQRTRWEHGHLSMVLSDGFPKLWQGVLSRKKGLSFLALDLCIPPIALLVLSVCVVQAIAALFWAATGIMMPFVIGLVYLLLVTVSVILAWQRFGRQIVSGRELLMTPVYVLSKLPVYASFLFRRQAQWVRSKRDNEPK